MTTVRPTDVDDPGAPIHHIDELIAYIASAEKPRALFAVGTEHEKFGWLVDENRPLPFDGPRGIEALLHRIAAADPLWEPADDRGRTIALFRGQASITLEPGGQFELSGAVFASVHDTHKEVQEHMAMLSRHLEGQKTTFLGLGFQPFSSWNDIPMVPKNRYDVMQKYMPRVGKRGLDMMKRTATVQANYDWCDEADMVASHQAALLVAPLVAALFANSPFVEGRPSGALSERQRVWADTDRARSGFPSIVLDKALTYRSYVEWVLDVPMYFVRRDGLHHDVSGASFRRFMSEGLDVAGVRQVATVRDFADHLTTLFPEVRLKKVIEVRSADCVPSDRVCALPALYKGILYNTSARDEARALMDGATSDELHALRADVAERGFRAVFRGQPILQRCRELVDIASQGLRSFGLGEEVYLLPLAERNAEGVTFAEILLQKYNGAWKQSLVPLVEEAAFFPASG
jgi:glutamate--cysteine ligase